ncbi:hypothetical protein ACHQM5_005988 [Ranunculus cassubicifolius]
MNFSQKENEVFFECWERFKELLLSCPHHGYEIWRVISFFYDGLTSTLRQFVEMMCNGEFMNKDPEEYLESISESSQSWDTSHKIDRDKPKPSTNSRGAFEAIEIKKQTKAKESVESICGICESDAHCTKDCPTIPAFKEVLHDQANAINTYKRPFSQPYNEASNFNWRKHPNFSWRNGPTANEDEKSSRGFESHTLCSTT